MRETDIPEPAPRRSTRSQASEIDQRESRGDNQFVELDSAATPDLSVVLPTLNEERGVRVCIERIKRTLEPLDQTFEIIVSDSSTDRTPEIARELGATVVHPGSEGYGNAYKHAFEHAEGEFVAIGDADATYDFTELPKLLNTARETGADLVLGSRFKGEIKPGAMPALHQYVGNPLLTWFLNTFYSAGVSDAHSGMRVVRRDALEELELHSGGMEFASEMIMEAATKDMTIEEVPITYHERVGEATLDSFSDGWRHVKFMLKNAPGYLFTLPSLLFGVLGLVVIGASVAGVIVGPVTFGIQTLIGGVLLTVFGYQIGNLAIFSSIAADPIRHPQDPITDAVHDRFTLEAGAVVGLLLLGAGAAPLGYGVVAWAIEGYDAVPPATWNLLAAAAVFLGVQTVFNSFFFSLLVETTD